MSPNPNSPWPHLPWGFYYNRGCRFTSGLSWPPFRDSSTATHCQASVAPHDLFIPSKSVTPDKVLHITNFSCQHEVQDWLPQEHSFWVLTLRKHLPEDFAWSLVHHLIFHTQLTRTTVHNNKISHLARRDTTHSELDPFTLTIDPENAHRFAHSPVRHRHSSSQRTLACVKADMNQSAQEGRKGNL